jgi:2-polyprenyl-6-hydroxyphenyl methylase/3-demethylubiquinone-9 3-methyltransferase
MNDTNDIDGYRYSDAELNASHAYLLPAILAELDRVAQADSSERRIFDLGCGNGSIGAELAARYWQVTGVDPSSEGIARAKKCHPHLRLESGSAYDDLAAKYGRFPVVVSLEVIEHVYAPRQYVRTLFDLVETNGIAIISTPYHGYFKNLSMALTGKMDAHFTALWDHGHIKFWSFATLGELLREVGFVDIRFKRVGRIPPLAKSMIAIARKG